MTYDVPQPDPAPLVAAARAEAFAQQVAQSASNVPTPIFDPLLVVQEATGNTDGDAS